MNTRLQVEHPVTEAITGQDLVEWQLRVASGEPLPKAQHELAIDGWAMEARLYAENPSTGFLPSTGRLEILRFPAGIRVDSGVEQGDSVTPHYDPMIAKLIVHEPTRKAAAAALSKACAAMEVWPVKTNAAFLARAALHGDFVAAHVDTGFIERHAAALVPSGDPPARVLQAAAQAVVPPATCDPWTALRGFRSNAAPDLRVEVEIGGSSYLVMVDPAPSIPAPSNGLLFADGEGWPFGPRRADHAAGGSAAGDGAIMAPMPGRVIEVAVEPSAPVTKGQKLVVLEAMKMELALVAPFDGTVTELKVVAGAQVAEGTLLARIKGTA